MYLKYGTYTHQLDECSVRIRKRFQTNDAGVRMVTIERWEISGRLQGDDAAALTTSIQALEAAYAIPYKDLTLLLNDGSTESAHKITSRNTLAGAVILELGYPQGDGGGEYNTYRNFELVAESQVQAAQASGQQQLMESYSETLSFRGTGGPRRVIRELRNGPPQVQIVSQQTPIFATQSGTAVGFFRYPNAPGPMFPEYEDEPERQVSQTSPDVGGSGANLTQRRFTTSWVYQFKAPGPVNNTPGIGFR